SITNRDGLKHEFSYDDQGREAGETWYAGDGSTVTDEVAYSYDAAGRLASAGDWSGTYSYHYDSAGRLSEVDGPYGVVLTYGYDASGNRVLVQDSFGGTTTSSYDSSGDLLGR